MLPFGASPFTSISRPVHGPAKIQLELQAVGKPNGLTFSAYNPCKSK